MELIPERLAAEESIRRVVESYPRLDGESVGGALLFAAGRVEEMLARLGLTEEPLVDAVTALDEHSEEDEKIEAPPRRYIPDEAEPPALRAVAEKVLPLNALWHDVYRCWRFPLPTLYPSWARHPMHTAFELPAWKWGASP